MRSYIQKLDQLTKYLGGMTRGAINLSWKAVPANFQEKALDMFDKVIADGVKNQGKLDELIDQYAGDLKEKCPKVIELAKGKLKEAIEKMIEDIKKAA